MNLAIEIIPEETELVYQHKGEDVKCVGQIHTLNIPKTDLVEADMNIGTFIKKLGQFTFPVKIMGDPQYTKVNIDDVNERFDITVAVPKGTMVKNLVKEALY